VNRQSIFIQKLDVLTGLDRDTVELGKSLVHTVQIGCLVEDAQELASGLTCVIRATPLGWVSLGSESETGPDEKVVTVANLTWAAPPRGRRGRGSMYFAVADIAITTIFTTDAPPRDHQGTQRGEVHTELRGALSTPCALDDLFSIIMA
jgi:hypothetical protein